MAERTPPDDITEGLRELYDRIAGALADEVAADEYSPDHAARVVVAALAELADPGDLPARMLAAIRSHTIDEDREDWWDEQDPYCVCGEQVKDWDEHAAKAALSVRWEAFVQQGAENAALLARARYVEAELQGRTERAWQAQRERDEARRELADVHHDLTLTVGDAYTSARSAAVEVMRQLAAAEAEVERLRAELAEARAKHQTEIASLQRLADRFRQQDDDRHARLLTERDALKAAIERVRAQGTFWSVCAAETVAAFGRGVLAALDAPETPEERNA